MARAPFTYPFCYIPAPDIVAASQRIIDSLDQSLLIQEGKMLGVLKVEDEKGAVDYLYAFSGTVGGRAVLPDFVPPIYDLTEPEGYFRRREAEISAMPAGPERAAASAELQAWLFEQYRVSNARGETLSIREVFARRGLVPPGGPATARRQSSCNMLLTINLRPSRWANSGTAPPLPRKFASRGVSILPARENAARS